MKTLTNLSEEVVQLKKNVAFLRDRKNNLEKEVHHMRVKEQRMETEVNRYKSLWEKERGSSSRGGGLEISDLNERLEVVIQIKNALAEECETLRRQLREATENSTASGQAACVVCMDHLVDIVCLPCKHLALCSYCAAEVNDCPICRASVAEKLHIYTP